MAGCIECKHILDILDYILFLIRKRIQTKKNEHYVIVKPIHYSLRSESKRNNRKVK